ncbi:MAG: redox-regulated ATPase YchF [Flavobacteriales bacterium]|nr:redox-regulated ATPase YchF [Flavobacteriales bacterium]|tara:strand:+ start:15557 stop:16654 length:1098 start_codon:yes stop_codon:yes gene_type:complete
MALKCGIVGLPNVGKSTLFNCLSKAKAQSANFPFCTIEPNVGIITVPDERLETLANIVNPERVMPTTVEVVDIAGLVKGASKGEGLGNKFLGNIRETNAIIHVLRCFEDENIVHVDGSVNPVRDKETIDMELQLKDLETLEKLRDKNIRTAKSGDKLANRIINTAEKYIAHLEAGNSARSMHSNDEELEIISDLHLITAKPVLYICNVNEVSLKTGNKHVDAVKDAVKNEDAEVILIATAIESEIAELDEIEEQQMFLEELGLEKPGVHYLIQATYKLLNLQTFFTAGAKEVRAWTIKKGMKAPKAAAVIHTDFEKGFIRAEVISYNDFINLGSEQASRDAGKLSIEGKDYMVKDGDIIHFRFNV